MDFATAFAQAVAAAMTLWGTKEARKYQDEINELERKRYVEKQKPEFVPLRAGATNEERKAHEKTDWKNMALVDDLDQRLFLLGRAALADATKSKVGGVSG